MKLMVLDGNSIVNRAFYGVRLLSNSKGQYTNAVYGFLMILQKLISEDEPDALCVTFDLKAPTFRHKMYEGYKAQRKGMPEELAEQMPVLKDVLDAMNIPRYELEGYEADDLIGTVSRVCAESGWQCTIVTGDRDSLQLIGDDVSVKLVSTKAGKTETTLYDTEKFTEVYGFTPKKMIDLKALMGDASDNIPGVAGIGEKTALDLVRRFGELERILRDADTIDIKKSVREKLIAGADSARMSYTLAEINRHAPIEFVPDTNIRKPPDRVRLLNIFRELEFTKLIEKFGLEDASHPLPEQPGALPEHEWVRPPDPEVCLEKCRSAERVFFVCPKSLDAVAFTAGGFSAVITHRDTEGYDAFLKAFFSEDIKKVSHDIKPLMTSLLGEGIEPAGFVFDTALAAYVRNPAEKDYTLSQVSERLLSVSADEKAFGTPGAFDLLGGGDEAAAAMQRCCSAVEALYDRLSREIEALGMHSLYYDIELPLCIVLSSMENTGVYADKNALHSYGEQLSKGIDMAEKSIYDAAGEEFNINSPKQLGEMLFDKMKLPFGKKTKSGYATDADTLSKLRPYSPVIDEILAYRQLTKLKSTYADGLYKVIGEDGRIHTKFNMTVTATGRLSSTEPNLQNIPVRTELGGEIRRMFVPGEEGWQFVDADYSQIELRILAHISGDKMMIKAFESGEDIHRATAAQVFGVEPEDVTSTQRSRAKAVNFGIVYGISKFSLAQDIGVSVYEAGEYMDRYLEKYSGVREYMKTVVDKAKADGYVTTLFGRRRYLPELQSSNRNVRAFGERVALNMPIQGTAADIMKIAMIRAFDAIRREKLRARLILQVHDELIAEAPDEEVETVKRLLSEAMEGAASLSVPLTAEAHSGATWYDAK